MGCREAPNPKSHGILHKLWFRVRRLRLEGLTEFTKNKPTVSPPSRPSFHPWGDPMAQDGPKTGTPSSVQTLEHTGLARPEVSGKLEKLLVFSP